MKSLYLVSIENPDTNEVNQEWVNVENIVSLTEDLEKSRRRYESIEQIRAFVRAKKLRINATKKASNEKNHLMRKKHLMRKNREKMERKSKHGTKNEWKGQIL